MWRTIYIAVTRCDRIKFSENEVSSLAITAGPNLLAAFQRFPFSSVRMVCPGFVYSYLASLRSWYSYDQTFVLTGSRSRLQSFATHLLPFGLPINIKTGCRVRFQNSVSENDRKQSLLSINTISTTYT